MDYKIPKSVLVLVHTATQVLLLERVRPQGFWQSVTGSLEAGERWQQAAERELREETGFAATGLIDTGVRNRFPIVPPWSERYAPGVTENEERIFTLCLARTETPRLRPEEHCAFAWLSPTEAAERCGSWTNRNAIIRLFGNLDAGRAAS
ncbi:dihydroneopterin triphosphate diphosphatase [Acidithiobacillus sp. CV18-2]|uniref:Dihydroneopterin triphosphate diphosphatase n=1 Tax=Igneacidithiobacillus copahuensis TaxID=2724909 RepID=A0AAE2YS62_9PROT|nr:dihydroneopterin triphosphate diphosphatase [Igneacidithiobacillus copahuensis]MBU2755148.1 dihydroneopterin triphosphate diphosphatase [Acidithiobacillus sp. CV18-3]MBU2758118.1 dihydroneopterin triphosphate diphosphatase [Acidithiobacillus sp. BN09-2]MBU2777704.1 dihydroneopterin triphosphate diphosphatase [Acidithiobacillus sp. CV18-2]MBU2797054.1 dihydroneopterin triphosphate diphosphatase [Acidithiobacillus sp. VAN18-2]MBU2798382.1 dihydroneopterin triphosphate diphosphatase [Acidithio